MALVWGLPALYLVLVALLWAFQERITFPAPRSALPDPEKVLGYGQKIELRKAESGWTTGVEPSAGSGSVIVTVQRSQWPSSTPRAATATEPVAFFTESVPVSAPEAARAASGAARAAASRHRTRYRRISLAVLPGLVRFA